MTQTYTDAARQLTAILQEVADMTYRVYRTELYTYTVETANLSEAYKIARFNRDPDQQCFVETTDLYIEPEKGD